MLVNLHVKNLAVIDELEVDFTERLNILTGETGAGKSILIDSVNIALGGKVSADVIRKGAKYAFVELTFQITEEGVKQKLRELEIPMEDDTVIISRRIKHGRSISKVNGESAPKSVLKKLAGCLIDIHGQHEHQSLLYKHKHLEILDRFSREETGRLKRQIAALYQEYRAVSRKLTEDTISDEERLRELSFLQFEKEEIENANLVPGEEEELEAAYKKLLNSNVLAEGIGTAYRFTDAGEENLSDLAGRAVRQLSALTEYDESLSNLELQLQQIENLVSDVNREIKGYMDTLEYDPAALRETEERLQLIRSIKYKYGGTLQEVESYYQKIQEKLNRLEGYEDYRKGLLEQKEQLASELEMVSAILSQLRKDSAKDLEREITEALIDLNFLDVRFSISFGRLESYTASGFDDVEFLISTNPGEEMKPLGRVASGGELSRIMLAIKSVLADRDTVDTLIFDEIDTGISGRTAQKVSERLALIARSHQVISITHLPQIASMADTHFLIEKSTNGFAVATVIRELDQEGRIGELGRMLGGAQITRQVLASAREMRELADAWKTR